MSSALIAPELEIFPNRYRWTVAECYAMAAEGRLIGRYEIIDGEVIGKMGQKPPHRAAIIYLQKWLLTIFNILQIQSEAPIALPDPEGIYSEPEPDVVVTREPTSAYMKRQPGPKDLVIVMEVSDTSLLADLVVKARLYARASIREYWVLDLNARQMHIHREPINGEYSNVTIHPETEMVSLIDYPDNAVIIADILPPFSE